MHVLEHSKSVNQCQQEFSCPVKKPRPSGFSFSARDAFSFWAFQLHRKLYFRSNRDPALSLAMAVVATNDDVVDSIISKNPKLVDQFNATVAGITEISRSAKTEAGKKAIKHLWSTAQTQLAATVRN